MAFNVYLILIYIGSIVNSQTVDIQSHPCQRDCDGRRMVCEYTFAIEYYQSLSSACFNCPINLTDCYRRDCIFADGYRKPLQVVNRMLPGPKVEVCQGDTVRVTVKNHMLAESTTIHWHGLHQVATPYMDGVPYVTQCPIPPHSVFEYEFVATESGTNFWHSHSGFQRGNGLAGPFVVRRPRQEERRLYDFDLSEHIILTQDWTEKEAKDLFIQQYYQILDETPRSILVNGFGRFTNVINGSQRVPAARFVVRQGFRYRFRIIQSAYMSVPVQFSIDNHNFSVIASDGNDIEPIITESLTVLTGERYDIVVNTKQRPGLYWMRFVGQSLGRNNLAMQAAVLQYRGQSSTDYPPGVTPTYDNSMRSGLSVNGYNMPPDNTPVDRLRGTRKMNPALTRNDIHKFYLTSDLLMKFHPQFQVMGLENQHLLGPILMPHINNINLALFDFPLLSQRNQIVQTLLCNQDTISDNCKTEVCMCPHIIQVPLNSTVEFIFVDEGSRLNTSHPIHLHGHSFVVVGSGHISVTTNVETVKKLDSEGKLKRNFNYPPIKDTVSVPDGGYTIVRFQATNPGFWLMHCHIENHAEIGMALVVQVGTYNQMLPVPENFPTCGNYFKRRS